MKKMIFGLLFVSTLAQANTVVSTFNSDSLLPLELKVAVLNQVAQKCSEVVAPYGLLEKRTASKEVVVDQGSVDKYFFTVLDSRYYFDGTHPAHALISVKSVEMAVSNPAVEKFQVLEVNCQYNGLN